MSRLDRTLRILERTPWQVCGVAGFSALVGIGISGETAARDAPTCTVDGTRPSIVLASEHIERLRTCGYVVVDGAISRSTLGAAICETAALAEQGRFASTDQHSAHVRSDSILWLDGPTASVAGSGLHDSLHGLRGLAHQLAQGGSTWPGFVGQGRATLGVTRAGQLATYRSAMKPTDEEGAVAAAATGGARYRAHRDGIAAMGLQALVLPGIFMREVTAVLYLTPPVDSPPDPLVRSGARRRPPSSGALLLYVGAEPTDATGHTAASVVEIAPVGGRLVLFDSRTMLHEVTPHTDPHVDRVALTLWVGGPYDLMSMLGWCRSVVGNR